MLGIGRLATSAIGCCMVALVLTACGGGGGGDSPTTSEYSEDTPEDAAGDIFAFVDWHSVGSQVHDREPAIGAWGFENPTLGLHAKLDWLLVDHTPRDWLDVGSTNDEVDRHAWSNAPDLESAEWLGRWRAAFVEEGFGGEEVIITDNGQASVQVFLGAGGTRPQYTVSYMAETGHLYLRTSPRGIGGNAHSRRTRDLFTQEGALALEHVGYKFAHPDNEDYHLVIHFEGGSNFDRAVVGGIASETFGSVFYGARGSD